VYDRGPGLTAPGTPADRRRLLVYLDGSTASAGILPIARAWATELDLEIVLLHVAYPAGDPTAGQGNVLEETRVVTAELKRTAADPTDVGIDVRWHVVEDTAAATGIVRQAAHRAAALTVMATHGRTGLAPVLAGSVATEVIRHAPVPVAHPAPGASPLRGRGALNGWLRQPRRIVSAGPAVARRTGWPLRAGARRSRAWRAR
jgi:nucleotide-binding universal stress UspA family protein